jgi:uncharacterized LabA/DUF88 family protein
MTMAYRVRLFLDFWNFQLAWNDHLTAAKQCDWPRLPLAFVVEAQSKIAGAGVSDSLQLEEARVYASYNPGRTEDTKLKAWLSDFLDRQASFRVFAKERKDKPAKIYCRQCQQESTTCPSCNTPLVRSRETGVDTAIVTDMLSLAWESAFDVGILVSSDADMIPCVERIQEKGFKVVNAAWPKRGQDLAKAWWASFDVLSIAAELVRPARTRR